MRRRFSRRRRGTGSGDGKSTPIDAARSLERIAEAGIVSVPTLEVLEHDDIPVGYAALGTGQAADGTPTLEELDLTLRDADETYADTLRWLASAGHLHPAKVAVLMAAETKGPSHYRAR